MARWLIFIHSLWVSLESVCRHKQMYTNAKKRLKIVLNFAYTVRSILTASCSSKYIKASTFSYCPCVFFVCSAILLFLLNFNGLKEREREQESEGEREIPKEREREHVSKS